MRKHIRHEQILKRKNFLPTLVVTILLWMAAAGLVYFIDPDLFGMIPLFFILVFFCLLFTFSLIFANKRRGLIASTALSVFLVLAYFGVGNILNLFLIIAITICIELYFSLK